MTELSAAAQAVLAAVTQSQYGLEPEDVPNEAARIACEAAAALRAAATQAKRAAQPHPSYSEEQFWAFCCGAGTVGGKILAIADELDGINHSESD